jgi:hypothetical protein
LDSVHFVFKRVPVPPHCMRMSVLLGGELVRTCIHPRPQVPSLAGLGEAAAAAERGRRPAEAAGLPPGDGARLGSRLCATHRSPVGTSLASVPCLMAHASHPCSRVSTHASYRSFADVSGPTGTLVNSAPPAKPRPQEQVRRRGRRWPRRPCVDLTVGAKSVGPSGHRSVLPTYGSARPSNFSQPMFSQPLP